MTSMSDLVLKIKGLGKSFAGVKALDGVDLEVGRGEFVCLVGPDGAGKTTLIRLICGLEQADRGEIEYFGRHRKSWVQRKGSGSATFPSISAFMKT
jgi:ABC-type Fe3+/spermidine/putrescine transport system ATPase subunit